jgi:predicted nucleic acid-binding protein
VILVDSSVWIDHLRNAVTRPVSHLRSLISREEELLVGDLILCEILQGLRTDKEAKLVEEALREFEVVSLVGPELAVKAAANYRFLRSRGFTIRRTIDLMIGTFCIERGHYLLHGDRDFAPMEQYLGLQTV